MISLIFILAPKSLSVDLCKLMRGLSSKIVDLCLLIFFPLVQISCSHSASSDRCSRNYHKASAHQTTTIIIISIIANHTKLRERKSAPKRERTAADAIRFRN